MRLLHILLNLLTFRFADGGEGGGGDGGSEDGDGSDGSSDEGGSGGEGDAGDGDAELGDKGEKALNAWKERAKTAEKEAKEAKKLREELDALKEAGQTEQEKELKKAREEAAAEARKELEGELFSERKRNAILAAASGRVRDPEDAVLKLLDQIELTEDGKPDPKAVKSAIDDLLEAKPHWAAEKRRNGDGDQGGRGSSDKKPTSLEGAVNQRLGAT